MGQEVERGGEVAAYRGNDLYCEGQMAGAGGQFRTETSRPTLSCWLLTATGDPAVRATIRAVASMLRQRAVISARDAV